MNSSPCTHRVSQIFGDPFQKNERLRIRLLSGRSGVRIPPRSPLQNSGKTAFSSQILQKSSAHHITASCGEMWSDVGAKGGLPCTYRVSADGLGGLTDRLGHCFPRLEFTLLRRVQHADSSPGGRQIFPGGEV